METSAALLRPLIGIHVLVVDDNEDAREMLAMLLTMFGASATSAGSVDEAMEMLRRAHFDVVLSDVHMPDEDGLCLIRRLRAEATVPVAVALTADSDPELRDALVAAGFCRRLVKPVESAQLVATLRESVRAA